MQFLDRLAISIAVALWGSVGLSTAEPRSGESPPIVALATLSATAAAPPGQPLAIGIDHHHTVDVRRYPWTTIGKLFNSTGSACTAVAIAPDRVLTAAHCLYAFRTRRFVQPDAVHVLFGYVRGDYRVHARGVTYALGPGYDPTNEASTASADWAVLLLSTPLPSDIVPIALAAAPPASGAGISTGGFAQDRAYVMTVDPQCHLSSRAIPQGPTGTLSHDCVTEHGDSGAPLLLQGSNYTMEVIAVTVGVLTISGRSVGIAAPVTTATVTTPRRPGSPTQAP